MWIKKCEDGYYLMMYNYKFSGPFESEEDALAYIDELDE